MITNLYIYAKMLALLTSIFCLKRLPKTPLVYFFPYLAIIVTIEWMGIFARLAGVLSLSNQLGNLTTVLEFCFFYFLFYRVIKKESFRKVMMVLAVVYLLSCVTNIFFLWGSYGPHFQTVLPGTIIIIIFVFMYFYYAVENNEPIDLIRAPMFWISMGIFLVAVCDFTFNLMHPFLIRNHLLREQYFFLVINRNLIIFEYLCFSVALIICSKKNMVRKQRM